MSILVVGPASPPVPELLERLVSQGDEVRIVGNDPGLEEAWRSHGVHVARGVPNADLVERAAQNCRTVVLVDDGTMDAPMRDEVLEGSAAAGVERVVVCARRPDDGLLERLEATRTQFVVLIAGGRGGLFRKPGWTVGAEKLARAVDAADDLGGSPRLVLDLSDPGAWAALGLAEP